MLKNQVPSVAFAIQTFILEDDTQLYAIYVVCDRTKAKLDGYKKSKDSFLFFLKDDSGRVQVGSIDDPLPIELFDQKILPVIFVDDQDANGEVLGITEIRFD